MNAVMMICQRAALLNARLIVVLVTLFIMCPWALLVGQGQQKDRVFSAIPLHQVKRNYAKIAIELNYMEQRNARMLLPVIHSPSRLF